MLGDLKGGCMDQSSCGCENSVQSFWIDFIPHRQETRRRKLAHGPIHVTASDDINTDFGGNSCAAHGLNLGSGKVGLDWFSGSGEFCLRFQVGEGDFSLCLDGGWKVLPAPSAHGFDGRVFQCLFDSLWRPVAN